MRIRIVANRTAGLLAIVLIAGSSPVNAETAVEITDRVRAALGIDAFESQGKAIEITGETELLEMKGPFSFVFDPEGRFHRLYKLKVPNEAIFDGKTVRSRDIGGEVSDLSLGDRTEAIFNSRVMTGLWFSKRHADGFEIDENSGKEGTVVLRRDIDDGRSWARVEIDRESWIPKRWEILTPTGVAHVTLKGARKIGPLTIPRHISIKGPNGGDNTLDVGDGSYAATPDWAGLIGSMRDELKTTFAKEPPAKIKSKRANTGHLLVHPRINGKDVGWFIFDTGAGQNVIDNRVIDEEGLKTFAAVPAVGAGGAAKASLCRARELTLGRLTLHEPILVGMDLAFLDAHMGEKIAGIIGYGTLARCVVEFDQAQGEVSIYDPAQYAIAGAEWTPLMIYSRHPCVPGEFEGHEGVFRLDTGASGTLTFHAPTVDRLKLLKKRKTRPTTIGGVGGFKPAKTGKVKSLKLGGKRYKKIRADFATESSGAFADPYIDANIGGELIGESVLILDYPNSRIAFKKRVEE